MKQAALIFSITLLISWNCISQETDFRDILSSAAIELTKTPVVYDPGYYSLDYPGGDLPANRGVCTDVIIRAYRAAGIDLQVKIHEDMMADFDSYPDIWGLEHPDKNIDHRRVPNLMVFFGKYGKTLPLTRQYSDYGPGEIVCWDLGGGIAHIGIVIDKKTTDGQRNLIVHNIGRGQEIEDCLFKYRITGHYYYE